MKGAIIAVLTAFAFIVGIIIVLAQHSAQQPVVEYAGVGLKDPGPGQWAGTHEVIDAIQDVLAADYPDAEKALNGNLWLVEVPPGEPVTSSSVPAGTLNGESINGTIDTTTSGPAGTGHYVYEAIVRRFPAGACSTDVVAHEVAEHIVPLVLTGNSNPNHDPKWQPLTAKILALCRQRLAAEDGGVK